MARRTPTIHHLSASIDDLDSETEISNSEYATYQVHIPPTPDNQPVSMEFSLQKLNANSDRRGEDQYLSGSLFTGGHNRATRALSKEQVI